MSRASCTRSRPVGAVRAWSSLPGLMALALVIACAPAPAPPSSSGTGPAGGGAQPAAGAPARQAPREPVDVTLAVVVLSSTQLPHYVGLKGGFFEEEGIRLTLQQMPTPAGIAAMMDGQVGYSTSGASIIRAAASGRPVRLIAGGKNFPDWQLFVQPGINSVQDLRGKRLGVLQPTGAATLVTFDILANYGVAKAEVEAINLQSTQGVFAGLVAKQVDGGLVSPPYTVYARREGLRFLLRSADEVQVLQGGLGTSVQRLRERPDEVEAMLRGLVRSTRAIFDNRELTVNVMAEQFELPHDVAADLYPDVAETFERDANASDEVIRREIAEHEEAIGEKVNLTAADVADFGPLRRAHEALAARERTR
jgi:ABC-type nitrate/sulfonate/bicarbonate transport system substrate-binding protein